MYLIKNRILQNDFFFIGALKNDILLLFLIRILKAKIHDRTNNND